MPRASTSTTFELPATIAGLWGLCALAPFRTRAAYEDAVALCGKLDVRCLNQVQRQYFKELTGLVEADERYAKRKPLPRRGALSEDQLSLIRSDYTLIEEESAIYAVPRSSGVDPRAGWVNVSKLFPSPLTKSQWESLVAETFNHQKDRLGARGSNLVTIGWCWVDNGQLDYERRNRSAPRKAGPKVRRMVFIHQGDRRQPEGLLVALAKRELGINSLAANPSGDVSVDQREREVLAKFLEQRRLSEKHMHSTGRIASLAEGLNESCSQVIERLCADDFSLDNLLEVAASAYEAGKAHAWIDTLKDEQVLSDNKKAVAFNGSAINPGTTWIKSDIERYGEAHNGLKPTASQLIKFANYDTERTKNTSRVKVPEEGWVSFRAFEKRVQRLVKRPRGRPQKVTL